MDEYVLAITTQKGDLEPSWGGKLCSISQTGGGRREQPGKELAAKQKTSLYCCINPWYICVSNAACSCSPREDVVKWEKVWQCWQESCRVTGGFGWEWEAEAEMGAATGWNFEELLIRRDKHWGNRYEMTPLWRGSNQALQLEKVTAEGATLEIGQVVMCTEMGIRNDHSLFITAWELGDKEQSYHEKVYRKEKRTAFLSTHGQTWSWLPQDTSQWHVYKWVQRSWKSCESSLNRDAKLGCRCNLQLKEFLCSRLQETGGISILFLSCVLP